MWSSRVADGAVKMGVVVKERRAHVEHLNMRMSAISDMRAGGPPVWLDSVETWSLAKYGSAPSVYGYDHKKTVKYGYGP
jgi:hypothetical protein